MLIFVTGATGFVGRHAAEALADAGHELRCLVRSRERSAHLASAGHELVDGDVLDPEALRRGVDGADAVLHVAGLIAARSATRLHAVNGRGTGLLAGACRLAGTPPRRFVLVSSLAAAGPGTPDAPRREDAAPQPVSAYGRSKLAGERTARRALPGDTELTIVRPPAVYGPHDRGVLDLFRAAARGLRPRIGTTPRAVSIVHGADLARALVAAVERPEAAGGVFHPVDPCARSMDDVIGLIAAAVGGRSVSVRVPACLVRAVGLVAEELARARRVTPTFSRDKAREFLAPGWVADGSAARRHLAWAPRIALDDGIRETARWYRAAGWI